MKRFLIGTSVAAAAVALLAPAAAAGQRVRPTDLAPDRVTTETAPNELQVYNDFASPSRAYTAGSAVVHYVVLGIDAPPLNDDDADGVPDYVERVAAAADVAIACFARRGFVPIRPDEGGPDGRPDIYVSRFAPGYLGVAFPAARAQGGAFVVVSNALDPSAGRSFASVYGTVAHELFHLVQFSYFPGTVDPPLPGWVLEGTAAAMEHRAYPELEDGVSALQLRRWLEAPARSLTTQTYGSQLLWRYLDRRAPRLLPAYLSRLAAGQGSVSASRVLSRTHARVTGRPFAPEFGRFAGWVADLYGERIPPRATLAPGARARAHIAPLAVHFVRLGRSTRSVALRFTHGRGAVELVLRLESPYAGRPATTRRLRPRVVGGARMFAIPAGAGQDGTALLVVANGQAAAPVSYSLTAR